MLADARVSSGNGRATVFDFVGSGGKATWIEPVEFLVVRSDNERIVNPLRDDPVERPEYVG